MSMAKLMHNVSKFLQTKTFLLVYPLILFVIEIKYQPLNTTSTLHGQQGVPCVSC